MGYAARSRGTFEERKKQSIERQEKEHQEWLKRIKAREANKTPKEREIEVEQLQHYFQLF